MPYNPRFHRRRSIRLRGYDYAQPGGYFVTMCAVGREPLFGHIDGGQVKLSPIGRLVAAVWQSIPRHFPQASLDVWVLMPDHLHGIVVIERAVASTPTQDVVTSRGTVVGSLPAMVQNFKAVSTKRINRLRRTPAQVVWQEDYFEHIVRDEDDLARIRRYIATNPARWRDRHNG